MFDEYCHRNIKPSQYLQISCSSYSNLVDGATCSFGCEEGDILEGETEVRISCKMCSNIPIQYSIQSTYHSIFKHTHKPLAMVSKFATETVMRLTVTCDVGRSSGITYQFDVGDIRIGSLVCGAIET